MLLMLSIASASDLLVEVRGLASDAGTVRCAVYDRPATWLTRTVLASAAAAPTKGVATCRFPDLPAGTYAATAMHDANDNGDMDFTLLGLPREAWGVSKDAPAVLGKPRFDAAAFAHDGRAVVIHVR
ncbi:MAG: DUF2141 domain-containing protein [Myxococcales bacterium]|nr:DUF2141 domain-containing protein [Myxococcales bacterium]MCB9671519.1 DUF2141 domain-containing protein [Alphaproteobacteria bacterium]MCB9691891.1 DUF2141 domain-containing protein [Alphaproteobacteria bacterium]